MNATVICSIFCTYLFCDVVLILNLTCKVFMGCFILTFLLLNAALAEASVIVREHTPITNLLMCLWFNEVVRFTSRDQLSFPFVLKHLPTMQINMFPVCTRRALVNSMGHKHKAKPLIREA